MKISVILAHPRPGSFNHAIADTAADTLREPGHIVTLHDLYREQSDHLLPSDEIARDAVLHLAIAPHCGEIPAADGIVFVHPDWWRKPPVIPNPCHFLCTHFRTMRPVPFLLESLLLWSGDNDGRYCTDT
jgi:hypothetical protein